jgi:hypothetical protein
MKPDYKTCWWNHSKQCTLTKCTGCLFYLSTLAGTLDAATFDEYRRTKLRDGLATLLSEPSVGLRKLNITSHTAPYMDTKARRMLTEELLKTKRKGKELLYLGRVNNVQTNNATERRNRSY